MARVACVGVGSVGAYFAAHLIEKQRDDVVLCVRRPFDELVLESNGEVLRSRPRVVTDAAQLAGEPPVDWVILATKATQTLAAAPWFDALVGPETRVAVLQNGIEHVERVQPLVDGASVVPTVVYCGSELVAPGHAIHRSSGFMIAADDADGQALAALYEGGRNKVNLTDDLTSALWTKLGSNAVTNGITALTLRRMEVFNEAPAAHLGRALANECFAVAEFEGATIDPDYVDVMLTGILSLPGDSGTSMLYDREAGRPMEVDAIYGAVQRAAARHGVAVPHHDTMVDLLSASAPPDTAGGQA